MKSDLLLKLADLLDSLPPERFDYGAWCDDAWDGRTLTADCGFQACALGWATTIPETGLELRRCADENSVGVYLKSDPPLGDDEGDSYDDSIRSARAAFELSELEATQVFVPWNSGLSSRASAAQVAAHIRRFVANRTAQ